MTRTGDGEQDLLRHIPPSARIGDWDEACAWSEKRYTLVAPERKSLAGYFLEEFLLVRAPCWRRRWGRRGHPDDPRDWPSPGRRTLRRANPARPPGSSHPRVAGGSGGDGGGARGQRSGGGGAGDSDRLRATNPYHERRRRPRGRQAGNPLVRVHCSLTPARSHRDNCISRTESHKNSRRAVAPSDSLSALVVSGFSHRVVLRRKEGKKKGRKDGRARRARRLRRPRRRRRRRRRHRPRPRRRCRRHRSPSSRGARHFLIPSHFSPITSIFEFSRPADRGRASTKRTLSPPLPLTGVRAPF